MKIERLIITCVVCRLRRVFVMVQACITRTISILKLNMNLNMNFNLNLNCSFTCNFNFSLSCILTNA